MARFICITLFVVLIFAPSMHADENTKHKETLSKYYRLEKPEGNGPFPAVMMVPWCFGFDDKYSKKYYDNIQRKLVELGFVTLRVNYLAARNADLCWPDAPTDQVANDIYIAAEYLSQEKFVKKGAINLIGWSWGGASTFRALVKTGGREAANVNAVIAYYPYCPETRYWTSDVPVLVFEGKIDNVVTIEQCDLIFDRVGNKDKLTIRVYEEAHHGFDNSELPAEIELRFGTFGYNETAANAAWNEVIAFLKR